MKKGSAKKSVSKKSLSNKNNDKVVVKRSAKGSAKKKDSDHIFNKDIGVHFVKVVGASDNEKLDVILTKNQKTGKSLGFCYFCFKNVADFDIVSDKHYECIGCGKKGLISKLKEENPNIQKWTSKREYLNSTVFGNSSYIPYIYHDNNIVDSSEDKDTEDKPNKDDTLN